MLWPPNAILTATLILTPVQRLQLVTQVFASALARKEAEDDRRAGEVIHRLRELLSKGEFQPHTLDLNSVIRDVVKLVTSDALIRNVILVFDLAPGPLLVRGDRVHLQQVILNLLLNAMEALAECPGGDRTVIVQTEMSEVGTVEVAIRDCGTGLRKGTEDLVFEPFYTTKPAGMGMGLSIARSIIEAHHGRVWAANNPAHGATFHLSLPRAGDTRA